MAAVDEIIVNLKRVLKRCDEHKVGLAAAAHVDLAIHLLLRERATSRA